MTTITILSPAPETSPTKTAGGIITRKQGVVRVGLLSNGKPNSTRLLDGVLQILDGKSGLKVTIREQKLSASLPASQDAIDRLIRSADLVVNATAD